MRLLVDAQGCQSPSADRGIGRYAAGLLQALVRTRGHHRVEVLLSAGADPSRTLALRRRLDPVLPAGSVHAFDAPWPWVAGGTRTAAEASYAAAVESLAPDALLVLSVFEEEDDNVLTMDVDVPRAAVVYDVMPALDPAGHLLTPSSPYWRRLAQLAEADRLLAISEHTRAAVLSVLGGRCPDVVTVGGGPDTGTLADGAARALLPAGVPSRFVLTVGGDHPRKNLDRLVGAWGRVPSSVRDGTALVVVCGLSEGSRRRLLARAATAGLGPQDVVLLDRVEDDVLAALYRSAHLFVLASLDEGLGMPPLEAVAAGCPTVLARRGALPELLDGDDAYFDPVDEEDMAAVLRRGVVDHSFRARLIALAAAAARHHTWEAAGRRAWEAFDGVAASRPWQGSSAHPLTWTAATGPDALAVAPGPVRVPPEEAHGTGLRVGLAAATAVVLDPTSAGAEALVAAGLVDTPLVTEEDLATVDLHDPVRRLRTRLAGVDESDRATLCQVHAVPPRWTLERPVPVWLVLSATWGPHDLEDLRQAADGAACCFGGPEDAVLAEGADAVVVEAGAVPLDALLRARVRGAAVVRVVSVERPPEAGGLDVVDVQGGPQDWTGAVEAARAAGRTTGWPWRG